MARTSSDARTNPLRPVPLLLPFAPRRGLILVVEDRDDVRHGLTELLELNGFRVVDAATAQQAIDSLTAEPDAFALVLLDLILPGAMSGTDVRTRQLSDPSLAAIPTIVVTASDPSPRAHASLTPAAWLEKPFHCSDLLDLVRRYVVPDGANMTA